MKKLTFRGAMIAAAGCFGLLTTLAVLAYRLLDAQWSLSLAITFGTTFYHFAMRLLVGYSVPNTFDYRSAWFQPKSFEAKLYRKLQVKKWKDHIPTYNPRLFSLSDNTPNEILAHMCQAEVVHEIIIVGSFLPVLFSLMWDSFWVFFITSTLAAAIDTSFVIMQRYNRPRLGDLLQKQQNRQQNKLRRQRQRQQRIRRYLKWHRKH